MKKRMELLEDLVVMKQPIDETLVELSKYSWDSEGIYYIILKKHVVHILELALNGKVTYGIIDDWANAIECREDLDFESEQLKEVVEELANPVLYGELNNNTIRNYLDRLKNS